MLKNPFIYMGLTLMLVAISIHFLKAGVGFKDSERLGKVVSSTSQALDIKVTDILEGYIPSRSKRDHILFIPEDAERTFAFSGESITGPLWDDITKAVQEYADSRSDIEELNVTCVSFDNGTDSLDETGKKVSRVQRGPSITLSVTGKSLTFVRTSDNKTAQDFKFTITVKAEHASLLS